MARTIGILLVLLAAVAALWFLFLRDPARSPERPEDASPKDLRPAPEATLPALPPIAAPAAGPPLMGHVFDAAGAPLPDAAVVARRLDAEDWPAPFKGAPAARADGEGAFRFAELAPGRYLLEVRDERGFAGHPPVDVAPGETREVVLHLLPEAAIVGRVVDESRRPLDGATVTTDLGDLLRWLRGETRRVGGAEKRFTATTNGAGAFRLERLPVGLHDLRISAPGWPEQIVRAVAAPADGIEIVLYRGFDAEVEVLVEGDAPPPWIRVATEPPDADVLLPVVENKARGVLTGLAEGSYLVAAHAPGCFPAVAALVVERGRTPPVVRLRLVASPEAAPGSRKDGLLPLAGIVVDRDGRPVEGVRVLAWPEGVDPIKARGEPALPPPPALEDRTGADGRFVLAHLPEGTRAELLAVRAGVLLARDSVLVRDGREIRLVVKSEFSGPVRGRLVAPGGDPIAGAHVVSPWGAAVSGADGGFEIPDSPVATLPAWILAAGRPPLPVSIPATASLPPDAPIPEILVPWEAKQLFGRIVDPRRAPLAGVRVRLVDPLDGSTLADGRTANDGGFALRWPVPPDKEVLLHVVSPDRAPFVARGDFPTLQALPDVHLPAAPVLSGVVAGVEAGAIVDVEVRSSEMFRSYPVTLDSGRSFRIPGLPEGRIGVRVVHGRLRSREQGTVLRNERETDVGTLTVR